LFFIVRAFFDFVQGWNENPPSNEVETCAQLIQVLAAVLAAHDSGFAHTDINEDADNFLADMRADGTYQLLLSDFGNARTRSEIPPHSEFWDFELNDLIMTVQALVHVVLQMQKEDGAQGGIPWFIPGDDTEQHVLPVGISYLFADFVRQCLLRERRTILMPVSNDRGIFLINDYFGHPFVRQFWGGQLKTAYQDIEAQLNEYHRVHKLHLHHLTTLRADNLQYLTAVGLAEVSFTTGATPNLFSIDSRISGSNQILLYSKSMSDALRYLDDEYVHLSRESLKVIRTLKGKTGEGTKEFLDQVWGRVPSMLRLLDDVKALVRAHWGFDQVEGPNKFVISDEQHQYLLRHFETSAAAVISDEQHQYLLRHFETSPVLPSPITDVDAVQVEAARTAERTGTHDRGADPWLAGVMKGTSPAVPAEIQAHPSHKPDLSARPPSNGGFRFAAGLGKAFLGCFSNLIPRWRWSWSGSTSQTPKASALDTDASSDSPSSPATLHTASSYTPHPLDPTTTPTETHVSSAQHGLSSDVLHHDHQVRAKH